MLYFLPFYSEQNNAKQINEDYIRSNETAFFASTKILFLEHSDIHAGVRGVGFYSNRYFDYSIEPRLELNLGINEYHNFNAGYMKTWQYSHLLLSSGSIMLNEVWIPASEEIQPSAVTQYNFGYNMGYKAYLLRLDFYHKEMFCLATYKDGYTAFEGDDNWKTKVETNGMGKSQGLEFYFKKTTGKLTGFTSYTLSKTTRQYPNINDGFEYLFDYDRTHSFSTYINYATKNKKDRKAIWSFSVYNLYNRQNPNFYYYNTNNTGEIRLPEIGSEILELKLYQISLFSFIPSVSYKVYFEKGEKMREKKKRSFKNWLYQID